MKQRIISGALIALVTIALILIGGIPFKLFALFMAIWGSYEFSSARIKKINKFEFYSMLVFTILINIFFNKAIGLVILLMIVLICYTIFDENETIEDFAVTFIESLILGFSIHYLIEIEDLSKPLMGFVVLIPYITDVCAYFVGMYFGKRKLLVRISPKKTIEGALGGWAGGAVISFIYAALFNFFYMSPLFIVLCSLILPLLSEIGDLVFSLIKRHYNVKDFSDLIKGHGGLLDRLDSLIFVVLIYGALASIFGIY